MKTISSIHNETIQHLLGLAKNSDYRRECKQLLLEGRNAIADVGKRLPITRLVVTDHTLIPEGLAPQEIIYISESLMSRISSVKTPEGIIAELPFPVMKPLEGKKIIALDRIRDPGNLGTLIRTALALSWDGLFLLPECTDPFGDKALRAAKGATFQLPLLQGTWDELHLLTQKNKLTSVIADMKGSAPTDKLQQDNLLLILGNEGEGVAAPQHFSHVSVTIPMAPSMSSLNVAVAGGILMYLLQNKA